MSRRGSFLLFAVSVIAVAVLLSLAIADASDESDAADTGTINITWNQSFYDKHQYNDINLLSNKSSYQVTVTVSRTQSPASVTVFEYDAMEDQEIYTGTTVQVTSNAGSSTTVLKLTFSNVSKLPDTFVMKITDDASAAKPKLSLTFHVHVADVIVTADDSGGALVTSIFITSGRSGTNTAKYSSYDDVKLINASLIKSEVKVVYDGATLSSLSMINVDKKESLNSSIRISFVMYSGNVDRLSVVYIPSDIKRDISDSYDSMPALVNTANIDLIGGHILVMNPSSDKVTFTNYNLDLGRNLSVDRLFTSGENGKFSNVIVRLNGAHVGYMTNIASKIGNLTYFIESGTIDYLCIGANSEHYRSSNLARMPTSYVSGDVKLKVSELSTVKNCIMGGGILTIPNRLCNDTVPESVVHSVTIDAPSITIQNSTAFLTENMNNAYQLSNYRIGNNVYSSSLMKTFQYRNVSVPIYSENGIWDSPTSTTMGTGNILSLNTRFVILKESVFTVSEGARVSNASDIMVSGQLTVQGEVLNNSVIQCIPETVIEGEVDGIGFIADTVQYSSVTSTINVMSTKTAVVIELPTKSGTDDVSIQSISAIFSDDRRSVVITAEEDSPIYGSRFIISLDEIPAGEEFNKAYRLDIRGIDDKVLSAGSIEVTLPADIDMCTAVYYYDIITNQYNLIESVDWKQEVIFEASNGDSLYVSFYEGDRPNPNPKPSPEESITNLDYLLISAIIAVLCVTVYALVTMKRD